MPSVARCLAAVATLVAVLACSNVGTCWLRLAASNPHDCCEQDTTMKASPRPCGSTAAYVPSMELQAPPIWVSAVPALPPSVADERPGAGSFAPAYRVLDPPLILRI
jgi:hypothetical protein